MMTVNLRLDKKRIEKGLTFKGLASQANVAPTTLSRIVNGDQYPHRRTIANLCNVLDCEPAEIGFGEVA